MRRIDPAIVPDIFKRLGKTPAQHITIDAERRCCCLLVAIYLDEAGFATLDDLKKASLGAGLCLDVSYMCGLIWGWDGFSEADLPKNYRVADMAKWRLGNADGMLAWRACDAERLVERKPPTPIVAKPAATIKGEERPWKRK